MRHPDGDASEVRAARDGDARAFRRLVERHADTTFALLLRLVGDRDLADELAQETFVRAWRGLGGFRAESRFRTWLLQIGVNLAREHRRRSARGPHVVSLESLKDDVAGSRTPRVPTIDANDPVERLRRRDLANRLEQALRKLPADYREAFVLKHVQGIPYETISRMAGVSVGALKVRVHRARTKLRAWLLADEQESREDGRLAGSIPGR